MRTILVIEDDKDIRENTCELLELEGYRVFTADNGSTGVDMANGIRPDVILCDILLPGNNGFEVLAIMKATSGLRAIPLIFISASVEKAQIATALRLGAAYFLKKPFTLEELLYSLSGVFAD